MSAAPYVIVGAGLCGASVVLGLRSNGFDGELIVVGDEVHHPYSRPPLSKALRAEVGLDKVYLRKDEWYDTQRIDLLLGTRVTKLDPSAHRLELSDGRHLVYAKCLLATGGTPRRLPVPGADLPGVVVLRTIEDAGAIGVHLVPGAPIVVVGAGFIGAEVAASATKFGCDVTILEIAEVPLARICGNELGELFAVIHREHGVKLHTGVGLERVEQQGDLLRAYGTDGEGHDAALVVIGVGLQPEVELGADAGLTVDNGIVVNEYCETSAPDVFAAGDVANHPNPILRRRMRLEHWQNAEHQGMAAAKTMTGNRVPFSEVPWVWSDQYDYNLQMVGYPEPTDKIVIRGDLDAHDVLAFFLRDGGHIGVALGVNRAKEVRLARRLIHDGLMPDEATLVDDDADLAALLDQSGA